MPKVTTLHFTDDADANTLLAREPLALLIGMLLDQQVPMEWAFASPATLQRRLGADLDAGRIAAMDPEKLVEVFCEKPALHRYPASMAKRVHAVCQYLVEHHGGDAEKLWKGQTTGKQVYDNLKALPGWGEMKARIFVAILGRRLGVTPDGWQEYAADWPSIADVDAPGGIAKVREAKIAWKEHEQALKAARKKG